MEKQNMFETRQLCIMWQRCCTTPKTLSSSVYTAASDRGLDAVPFVLLFTKADLGNSQCSLVLQPSHAE
jgi:hypothetical protein